MASPAPAAGCSFPISRSPRRLGAADRRPPGSTGRTRARRSSRPTANRRRALAPVSRPGPVAPLRPTGHPEGARPLRPRHDDALLPGPSRYRGARSGGRGPGLNGCPAASPPYGRPAAIVWNGGAYRPLGAGVPVRRSPRSGSRPSVPVSGASARPPRRPRRRDGRSPPVPARQR